MIDKEKAKLDPKKQWTKFIIVAVLYLAFLFWVKSWWGLLVLPFIYDVYISKKNKMAMVEKFRRPRPIYNGLGRCHCFCACCSLLH